MNKKKIEVLERELDRERRAKQQIEKNLEQSAAELSKLNEKLRRSNAQLETIVQQKSSELKGIFENIADAYVMINLNGNVLKMNDIALALLDCSDKKEITNLLSLVVTAEKEKTIKAFKKLYHGGIITHFIVTIRTRAKKEKLVHINASMIYDKQGHPYAVQGIARDITHEQKTQNKLKASENRLMTLIHNLNDAVVFETDDRKIVHLNEAFFKLFPLTANPSNCIGLNSIELWHKIKVFFEQPKVFIEKVEEIFNTDTVQKNIDFKLKNGTIVTLSHTPIIKSKRNKSYLWVYKEVTLDRNYRATLETQKLRYENIIANINLGLLEVDTKGDILMANQRFIGMSGYNQRELIGKKAHKFLPAIKEIPLPEYHRTAVKRGLRSYEIKLKTKAGDLRYWLISATPNYNINGNLIGFIGIFLDITEMRSLENQKEELLQKLSKSNAQLEEYAHVVSHDLKSPLRTIDALISWIKEDNANILDEKTKKNFNQIELALQKMEQLITDILKYSQITEENIQTEAVDLNTTVATVIKLLPSPKHITITIDTPLPIITGDPIRFHQLFQNLIGNAIKFIDKKEGKINIAYYNRKKFHEFAIKDNGIGIATPYQKKVFKIFETLDKNKNATGIGLSIVKKIVTLYQGKIWMKSKPKQGTTIYFSLKK